MSESDLPWVPGAIRQLLLSDPSFAALVPNRIGTRLPGDMTTPFAQIRLPGSGGDLGGGGYKPLVQVEGWAAPGGAEDAEVVVWRIASRAARTLRNARNVSYQTMHYSARVIDGPFGLPDESRGKDNPLYRAVIRAELTIHNR